MYSFAYTDNGSEGRAEGWLNLFLFVSACSAAVRTNLICLWHVVCSKYWRWISYQVVLITGTGSETKSPRASLAMLVASVYSGKLINKTCVPSEHSKQISETRAGSMLFKWRRACAREGYLDCWNNCAGIRTTFGELITALGLAYCELLQTCLE